jgi:hypothetical protein
VLGVALGFGCPGTFGALIGACVYHLAAPDLGRPLSGYLEYALWFGLVIGVVSCVALYTGMIREERDSR